MAGNAVHGSASTYRSANRKCRCVECTAANTMRARREQEVRRLRLADDPSLVVHGKASTYNNWGCRCAPCKDAHKQRLDKYRAEISQGALP